MNKNLKQNALCKHLGPKYSIRYIDFERCIYRDFGNGFDVEISGTHTTSERKKAKIYLWFDGNLIVTTVSNVNFDEIGEIVDELYELSCELSVGGKPTREYLMKLKESGLV